MKLIRFGEPLKEKPGIILENERFDVSSFGEDKEGDLIEYGIDGLGKASQKVVAWNTAAQ